jgi:hypothetical protein
MFKRHLPHFKPGHMNKLSALILTLLIAGILHASEPERFIEKIKLPTGQTVVVAEGDYEARSIGSFSVRLYNAAPHGDETTFFRAGQVLPRNGTIEKVVLSDFVGTLQLAIVVIVRSAGTGGYLSAHAFIFSKKRLTYYASVKDLPPKADPIEALRKLGRKHK